MSKIVRATSALISTFVLWAGCHQAHAKVVINDGKVNTVWLSQDGKRIDAQEAYKLEFEGQTVYKCDPQDMEINSKTGKPTLKKAK